MAVLRFGSRRPFRVRNDANADYTFDEPFDIDEGVLEELRQLKKLATVDIYCASLRGSVVLSNLSYLSLIAVECLSVVNIVEILIESPNLSYLGLSQSMPDYVSHDLLPRIISAFRRRRAETETGKLKLKGLRFGPACLPFHASYTQPLPVDILHELTDLTVLSYLQLDNGVAQEEPLYDGEWPIDPDFFSAAINLESLVVDHFTQGFLDLVLQHNYRKIADDTVYSSIIKNLEIFDYFEHMVDPSQSPTSENEAFSDGVPPSCPSAPLHESGFSWERLLIKGKAQESGFRYLATRDVLIKYLPQCVELRELGFSCTATILICVMSRR